MVDFSPRATHTNKNLKVCPFIPHVYLFSFAASLSQWPLVDRIIDKFHYMPKFEDAEQILEDKKPTMTSAVVLIPWPHALNKVGVKWTTENWKWATLISVHKEKRRNCTSDLRLWSLAGSWMIHWWFPVKAARPIVLTNMNTADIHQYNSNFSNNAISTKSIASCKCHPCLPFANNMNLRCHNLPDKRAHATAWFAPGVRSLRSSGARCVTTEAVLPDQMPAHHRGKDSNRQRKSWIRAPSTWWS